MFLGSDLDGWGQMAKMTSPVLKSTLGLTQFLSLSCVFWVGDVASLLSFLKCKSRNITRT
jgi:hypothetical protein